MPLTIGSGAPPALPVPPHVIASPAVLTKVKAISELAKTTPIQMIVLGDSNQVGGVFNSSDWIRDSFARELDRQMSWLRSNSDAMTQEILGPQTQVIKFSTMGNAYTNSSQSTPWHPYMRRIIGEPRTALGPVTNPCKPTAGWTIFPDPSIATNRFIGLIVDRTATGMDYERNMDRVAVMYRGVGAGQPAQVSTGFAIKANGVDTGQAGYSNSCSPFTIDIRDLTTAGIDTTTILATGWDEANATCIAMKAAILAITPTATKTIDPAFGAGGGMDGFLSAWVSGMTANKKWCVTLRCPDGAGLGGGELQALVLNNSTIAGGIWTWDMSFSGHAISQMEWRRRDPDGSPNSSKGLDPFSGDFLTCNYAAPGLAGKVLMRGENTPAQTGFYQASTWAAATATQHQTNGLHIVVCSLLVNDISGQVNSPTYIQNTCDDMIKQVVRVNPGAVVIFNLPPCQGFTGGNNVRDNFFTGSTVTWTDGQFRAAIKAAVAANSANAIYIDYQAVYGNKAPTVLKAQLGHFGIYKRQAADPIDVLHVKPPCWQEPSASDIGMLFKCWCYL